MSSLNTFLSTLFGLLALALFATLVTSITGIMPSFVGQLFYQAFSYATFYLPVYVALMAYLVFNNKASNANIVLGSLTFLPFLTLSLLLKTLLNSPEEMSFFEQNLVLFFDGTAGLVLTALLLVELLILARIAKILNLSLPKKIEEPLEQPTLKTVSIPSSPAEPPLQTHPKETVEADFNFTQPEEKSLITPLEEQQEASKTIRQSLQEVAYSHGDDDFAFLNSNYNKEETQDFTIDTTEPFSLDDDETTLNASNREFLNELTKMEKSANLVKKPHIDIEEGFEEQKQTLLTRQFETAEDPALDFLKEPTDNLPPHLSYVLTSKENEALSQLNLDIAENSKEESQMAELLNNANRTLDKALAYNEEPNEVLEEPNEVQKKNSFSLKEKVETSRFLDAFKNDVITSNTWVDNLQLPEEEEFVSPLFNEQLTQQVVATDEDEDEKPFESLEDKTYHLPIDGLLEPYSKSTYGEIDEHTTQSALTLENTLKEFNIEAKVITIRKGPVVTMFEILPSAGVKLSKIEALADNIAFRLAASRVRIVAPIPGKQAVGIEIPNLQRSVVTFSELISASEMADPMNIIPIALGKDIEGKNQVIDLTKTPHLLIAGSTGSGKSVCVNSIICSILYTRNPHDVRLILIDPKVVELKPYNDIPHLLAPVITQPKRALQAVQWAMFEMERRYTLLDSMRAKNIRSYNKKIKEQNIATYPLPYIVLVIDEFADLIATCGKELEVSLARLAAKSRASGIHLILATQRPSADVITGLIKANFPSRIAFMVPSKVDSRVILDTGGAEQLLGKGDMLFVSSWNPFTIRMQSAFLSEEEVDNITSYVKTLGEPDYIEDEMFVDDEESLTDDTSMPLDDDDPLFDKALEVVIEQRKASASYLQRRLKVGYNRAARLVELMEERGIVGPANGSKPRDLLRIP